MAHFKKFLASLKKDPLPLLGMLFFINTFFFVAKQVETLHFVKMDINTPNTVFYFFFLTIFITCVTLAWKHHSSSISSLRLFITRSLAYFLPATVLLLYGISASKNFHFAFQLGGGLLLILTLGLIFFQHIQNEPVPADTTSVREWF